MLTCAEAIAFLGDYLETTLGAQAGAALEEHLRACDECVAYLNTYRKTPDLVAKTSRVEMPPEMRRRLREFLLAKLGGSQSP